MMSPRIIIAFPVALAAPTLFGLRKPEANVAVLMTSPRRPAHAQSTTTRLMADDIVSFNFVVVRTSVLCSGVNDKAKTEIRR